MSNINITFMEYDKFGLESFADQLTKYLKIESEFVEGSFVLSLNSEFGSGKTTFLEMWKAKLQEENSANVVLLNSWQSDFHGDALLAIVSGLLDALGALIDKPEKESIKETAGKLSKFALSIGNDVVSKFTGINFIKAGKYAESGDSKKETTLGHACFEVYHEKQKIFDELKSQLTELTEKSEEPIIVIIDELDRCRPTYAIEFLETIKHFFDINGLIFVLGVDKGQLESSAKALFGNGLNFDEYYRKFAHRNVTLPVFQEEISKEFYRKLISEYLSEDAFKKRERFPFIIYEQSRTNNIIEICNSFSLNARQIHELFRIASHVFSLMKENQQKLEWGWHIGTIFIITLYLKENVLYHKIGKNEISPKEFTNHLKTYKFIQSNLEVNYNLTILLYLGVLGVKSPEILKKELLELGLNSQTEIMDEHSVERLYHYYTSFYGEMYMRSETAFSKIYKILEGLKTFAEI